MNKRNQTIIAIAVTTALGGGALLLPNQPAALAAAIQNNAAMSSVMSVPSIEEAVQALSEQGILQGYGDGRLEADKAITNAESLKMVVLALLPDSEDSKPGNGGKWYDAYVNQAVASGILADADGFQADQTASGSEFAALIAKALQRDVKSVEYWMSLTGVNESSITRGQAAQLLLWSEQSVRSASAQLLSVKALNAITLEMTFSSPLVTEDETTDAAAANMAFDNGLKIVNQPRLKTGAVSTYIVPVETMKSGTAYTLSYKGADRLSFTSSDELITFRDASQVSDDTFEVSSLRSDGVIDYGYVISAYSAGRGTNAVVLDENNRLNGQDMMIISSLATRKATVTPEGGEPIEVSYVGFTQSTDGKQEPKFRLPAGTKLEPGVTYTVSSDWFTLENAAFVAQSFEPLVISDVEQTDSATLNVTLAEDPGDELFAYRSVELSGSDGTSLTAMYKVQTRNGATGVFELQNGAKLAAGVTYTVTPAGDWATAADQVTFLAE